MKNFIKLFVYIYPFYLFTGCGGMDEILKRGDFELRGPYVSEKDIFFFNPALNSVVRIDPENGKISKFKIDENLFTIIEALLPSIFVVSIDKNSEQMYITEYDRSGKELRKIPLGSQFTSFELSNDKEYLVMRHSSKDTNLTSQTGIFFKNEIAILELKTGILKRTTLNFSITDRKLIFSDPSSHLLSILCKEGVIVMDYKNPANVRYVYLDIDKKSPEIDYALFSKNGKYLFLKALGRDDIYSLSITNENDNLSIKVNVPSSPYKGLVYMKPVILNNNEDTIIAQYTYPQPTLIIMSAESSTAYQNKISLDSSTFIIDSFYEGQSLFVIIVNYWLKYVRVVSIYPIAESVREEVKIFAKDFEIIGYSQNREVIALQYEDNGLSIKYIHPKVTEQAIKIESKEFSFNPYNRLFGYSEKFNSFYFVSSFYSGTENILRFYNIDLSKDISYWAPIDQPPNYIYSVNSSTFLLSNDKENNRISLVNFNAGGEKVMTYNGLKYNELTEF